MELHHWEGNEPKVNVEAFLQFQEEKLAQFASSSENPPARFFIIAKCLASCFESETVPNHTFKATLKMGYIPNELKIAKAYFTKKSDLLEQLKQNANGAAFKSGFPMTVTLQWNQEIPEKPFIELIQINSFDWHP